MALIGTLNTLITASTSSFDKGLKKVRGGLNSLADWATSTQGVVSGVFAALGLGAAVASLHSRQIEAKGFRHVRRTSHGRDRDVER